MSRTDDELLALAAKAGGIETRKPWNALTNSGDALELVVKLGISIKQFPQQDPYPPHVIVDYRTGPNSREKWVQEHEGNAVAATRRAIVLAAASIGEKLP